MSPLPLPGSWRGVVLVHRLEVLLQCVEARRPKGSIGRQPLVHVTQRLGTDPIDTTLGVGRALDQPRLSQHPQVFGDRGLARPHGGHEVTHRTFPGQQEIQDPPPAGFAQHVERRGHPSNMSVYVYNCQVMIEPETTPPGRGIVPGQSPSSGAMGGIRVLDLGPVPAEDTLACHRTAAAKYRSIRQLRWSYARRRPGTPIDP